MQDKFFYVSCFGFIGGIFLRSFVSVNIYLTIWLIIVSFAIILFHVLISKNKWAVLIGIFILAFSFGILRFHLADVGAPQIFESSVGQKISLAGNIIDEPSIAENNQKITVETEIGKDKTKILVSASLDESLKYGDQINFEGKLEKPDNFTTDQGKDFDYVNYLRKDGIFYLMKYPKIEILSHNNGNPIKSILFSAKEFFVNKIRRFNTFSQRLTSPAGRDNSKYIDMRRKFGGA